MKINSILLLLCLTLALTGCQTQPIKSEFYAMNTVMQITLYDRDETLLQLAQDEIMGLEKLLSVTKPESEIYQINEHNVASYTLLDETANLLKSALTISEDTNGLFDISVYPAVSAWGFINQQYRVPTQTELTQLTKQIGYKNIGLTGTTLTLPEDMSIDLGGIAKGYAADKVARLLKDRGCSGGILSLGGNVLTMGEKPDGTPFTVAVQDPADSAKTLGTLSLTGEWAVVTSGDSQRYFEQEGKTYHHIIDPRTAAPADSDLTSVTVAHRSATWADGLATALYCMGLEDGMDYVNQNDLQAIFVTKENHVYSTSGLTGLFTPDHDNYTFH